jgi:hypothetical protein
MGKGSEHLLPQAHSRASPIAASEHTFHNLLQETGKAENNHKKTCFLPYVDWNAGKSGPSRASSARSLPAAIDCGTISPGEVLFSALCSNPSCPSTKNDPCPQVGLVLSMKPCVLHRSRSTEICFQTLLSCFGLVFAKGKSYIECYILLMLFSKLFILEIRMLVNTCNQRGRSVVVQGHLGQKLKQKGIGVWFKW